jgi:hypothetical protein
VERNSVKERIEETEGRRREREEREDGWMDAIALITSVFSGFRTASWGPSCLSMGQPDRVLGSALVSSSLVRRCS